MITRPAGERGFALLLVFAMAAAIAIMLYMQLPRAAFEAQRMKEEMLIERGEQYVRGIQLYVAKNKRYPASLDDLEKSSGIRFLRQRYKDPLTGEDEWRLIHTDGVRLTDSKIQKEGDKKETFQNTFISQGSSLDQTQASGQAGGVNLALRRRPSDQAPLPGQGTVVNPDSPEGPPPPGEPPPNQNPQQFPPVGLNPQQPNAPGQQTTSPALPGAQPNPTGQPQPGPLQPGQQQVSQPGQPQLVSPGINMPGAATQPAAPGITGQTPQQQTQGVAAQMIRELITRPGQQGTSGTQGRQPGGQLGAQMGGGIAGVASKRESDSIKIYNERQKYDEWEFVYDFSKDKVRGAGNMQAPNMPGQQNQQQGPGSKQQSQSGFGSGTTSFGQGSSGFGQTNSGFGQSGSGFGSGSSSGSTNKQP